MQDMIGFALAGGSGMRAWPMSLEGPGHVRSKAVMRFLGQPVLEWLIKNFKSQGLSDYLMVVLGKENRYQIKRIAGYGEPFGVTIRYSPVRYDALNTGSADAVMQNLANPMWEGSVVVFPTDMILEVDLARMVEFHLQSKAAVTVGYQNVRADQIAGTYGLMVMDRRGMVVRFLEKPSWEEMQEGLGRKDLAGATALPTSTGFYLMDAAQVREIGQLPEVRQMRQERFDIGGDLLPWLVKRGYSVYGFPIEAAGDLGSVPAYLATMRRALSGGFNSLTRLMGEPFDRDRLIWIDQETLATKDSMGRSLLARIRRGEVRIKGKVRIGKFVTLGSGVSLEESNLDDECQVESDVGITGCSLGEGTMVGQGATLSEVLTGLMARIDSSPEEPTRLEGMVALGDEVVVEKGVQVRGPLCAHPKVVIPQGCDVPPKAEITTSAEAAEPLSLRESLRAGRQSAY